LTQEDELNLEPVPQAMQQPVHRYAVRLRALAGPNALALTLFGSIAAGSFDPKSHTARSVFIVEDIDLEMLRRLANEGLKLGKVRIAAPLIMTPGYILTSLNTFPLEFLEIQQHHIVVFGDDHFNELTLNEADLRHECERELKTILLGMRQALLAAAGRDKLLTEIEVDVAERMLRTLRGLLWLHGDHEPKPALATVGAAEIQFGKTLPGIRSAIERGAAHGWDEFKTLYADVEAVGTQLDAW
jgi:hypothetical protein